MISLHPFDSYGEAESDNIGHFEKTDEKKFYSLDYGNLLEVSVSY